MALYCVNQENSRGVRSTSCNVNGKTYSCVPSASNPTNRFMQGPLHGHIESATFVFSMYIH